MSNLFGRMTWPRLIAVAAGWGALAVTSTAAVPRAAPALASGPASALLVASAAGCEQDAKLHAPDALGANFGVAIAVHADTAVVGMRTSGETDAGSGAVHVLRHRAGAWQPEAKLLPPDPHEGDFFGSSVAIHRDTVVVGADAHAAAGDFSGAAYVFVRQSGAWELQATLLPSEHGPLDRFGSSVGIHGDTCVVGADHATVAGIRSGASWVYHRDGGVWIEEARLAALDGEAGDEFGYSMAVSEQAIAVGAPGSVVGGHRSGAVHVYAHDRAAHALEARLTPPDAADGDRFGSAVALDGTRMLAGAPKNSLGGSGQGAAYAFVRRDGVWEQEGVLTPGDATPSRRFEHFGGSVALLGNLAVVARKFDSDSGGWSGAAYTFERSAAVWSEGQKLRASDAGPMKRFGASVAISARGQILVGAPGDGHPLDATGAAYVFGCDSCSLDLDDDGVPACADECPGSTLGPTVRIGSCDTGQANEVRANGCTVADLLDACLSDASVHGEFVSCVAHVTDVLRRESLLEAHGWSAIRRCAARSGLP